jgi:hypothetical protein
MGTVAYGLLNRCSFASFLTTIFSFELKQKQYELHKNPKERKKN